MKYKECFAKYDREQEMVCVENYFYKQHKDEDCVMLLWEHRSIRFAVLKVKDHYCTMAIYPRGLDHEPLYSKFEKADLDLFKSSFSKRLYKNYKLWKEYYGTLVLNAL